jgi:hypothetical protein
LLGHEGARAAWLNTQDAVVSLERLSSLSSFRWSLMSACTSISFHADAPHFVFMLDRTRMVGWCLHATPWPVLRLPSLVMRGAALDTFFATVNDHELLPDAWEVHHTVIQRLATRVHRDIRRVLQGTYMHSWETYTRGWPAARDELAATPAVQGAPQNDWAAHKTAIFVFAIQSTCGNVRSNQYRNQYRSCSSQTRTGRPVLVGRHCTGSCPPVLVWTACTGSATSTGRLYWFETTTVTEPLQAVTPV